ncbi:MAG TPA: MoxR family ATPase [Saprospiraceae bacterium]|nr:MoxR family ATPase [Saprospiraceae bacterium]
MSHTIKYIANPAQKYALEAALEMNQPLLVTGEPGTGKTEMADWALDFLNQKNPGAFYPEVLRFNTKTISKATDLFYTYDALSHFQAANLRGERTVPTEKFITLNAFGRAIAYSDPARTEFAEKFGLELPQNPLNSVVLIDEVDKAPRDFTNDLLDEILNYRFAIRELPGFAAQKAPAANIVVILTSNSEKNLPDAFLRRCAFFHIEFPKGQHLRDIVELHLGKISEQAKDSYNLLFDFFEETREKSVRKAPATAELIAWLRILGMKGFHTADAARRRELLERNLSFLVKTKDDLDAVKELLEKTQKDI